MQIESIKTKKQQSQYKIQINGINTYIESYKKLIQLLEQKIKSFAEIIINLQAQLKDYQDIFQQIGTAVGKDVRVGGLGRDGLGEMLRGVREVVEKLGEGGNKREGVKIVHEPIFVTKQVQKPVFVTQYIDKPVYVQKLVEIPIFVEKIIEKQCQCESCKKIEPRLVSA